MACDRQEQPRRTLAIVVDDLRCHNGVEQRRVERPRPGVRVDVVHREVGTGHLEPDPVPALEQVARPADQDPVLVHLSRLKQSRFLERVAEPSPDYAVAQVPRAALGANIDELRSPVKSSRESNQGHNTTTPPPPRRSALEEEAVANLAASGVRPHDISLQRIVELRYKGQVHQVDTPTPSGTLTAETLERVIEDFERRYEALFGPGSGFREAGIESSPIG